MLLPQQAHGLGRLAQLPHPRHLVLPRPASRRRDLQLIYGRGHLGRRQVAGLGQPQAAVAGPVQQPAIRAHHPGRRPGVDLDPPFQLRVTGQPLHLPPRAGGLDRTDQFGHRRRHLGLLATVTPVGPTFERTVRGVRRRPGAVRLPAPRGVRRRDRRGEQLAQPDLDIAGAHLRDRSLELGQDLALFGGSVVRLAIQGRSVTTRHTFTLPAVACHLQLVCEEKRRCTTELRTARPGDRLAHARSPGWAAIG